MIYPRFDHAIDHAHSLLLLNGKEVDTGSWQGYKTQGKPDLVTKEILNLQLEVPVDRGLEPVKLSHPDELTPLLAEEIKPNLPWADNHFDERVSRDPSNPGEEYKNWPWWQGGRQEALALSARDIKEQEAQFTHTYQERFWPAVVQGDEGTGYYREGIRYRYGDLDDVVRLLRTSPYSRQGTFPIFFPEDTGAVHGGRIPCTLHYHFMLRDNKLHMWYPIRSCDLVRHFRDDLYMACRLLIWVIQELQEEELRGDSPQLWVDVRPGTLHFTAYSFHVHKGDLHHVVAR